MVKIDMRENKSLSNQEKKRIILRRILNKIKKEFLKDFTFLSRAASQFFMYQKAEVF
jgi:hypothetical protein